ncbi:hypothetical protein BWI15_09685 [Kribbella sp. ALI-6-A]|uniref:hypothetical protein n=1 Tax=Kribbella sp. ALI-6-A TaxID=1933817 RepID=UPI00097BB4F9|nr:hypothetical protein [Kribbella sp. ALI-6-A]ONI73697.1 hypothetical protein BWI15_09685 [Kribbella sp. ALI-6-A]
MSNRNSYDSGASGETQAAIKSLSAQIESLIAQHQANVKAMRGDATMTKVLDEYGAVEAKFNAAATEVQNIIKSLASTLAEFDTHADTAFKAASKAVTDIGNT